MTGKFDWSTIEDTFSLGGYSGSAVLSNSTALLALIALDAMQPDYLWQNFEDFDDVETAIDLAIAEIMVGGSSGGDMIQIAETVVTTDSSEVYVDDFLSGDYIAFKLIIQGMLSNYASNWPDHVEVEYNDAQSNGAYSSFGRFFYNGTPVNYQNLVDYPANLLYWASAAASQDAGIWGHSEVTIFMPQIVGYKTYNSVSVQAGYVNPHLSNTIGSGGIFIVQALTKILIRPYYGTSFLAGGGNEPSELRMTLYGLN